MWLVIEKYFVTSKYLFWSITASGISSPSMAPCCTAVKVSPQAIGTALPPSEENMPMKPGFCMTRYFTPLTSSGFSTGRTLLIMLRKPPSIQPSSLTPLVFELGGELLADRAIEHALGLRLVLIQERQVVELERRLDLGDDRVGDDAGIDGAEPHALEHRLLVAELPVGIELDLDAAIGGRLDALLEGARAGGIRVLRAVGGGPAELDDGLLLGESRRARERYSGGGECASERAARDQVSHGW